MGHIPACKSSMSVAVVCIAPVIANVAILCTDANLLVIPTNLLFLVAPTFFCLGVYHISATYVIMGMATALYICRINCSLIPLAGLASRRNARVHLAAFANAYSACCLHRNSWSIITPR